MNYRVSTLHLCRSEQAETGLQAEWARKERGVASVYDVITAELTKHYFTVRPNTAVCELV